MDVKRALFFWFFLLGCARVGTAQTSPVEPLFFAQGITQTSELDAYKNAGFNTVVIQLLWKPSATGFLDAEDLTPQREFALAASKRGLKIIYALPAAPSGFERSVRITDDSPAYVSLWTGWVEGAMSALRDTPNLVGWRLPDDPGALGIFDDTGFARWIARNYANTEILNRQWGTRYKDLGDASISDVGALVTKWKSLSDGIGQMSDTQLGDPLQGEELSAAARLAFHPASLALAAYKWDAYRALQTIWVGVVRGSLGQGGDSKMIFSGALPDYAQLLSQPVGVDVISPSVAPSMAENDVATHNPQALAIARRGGKFGVLPIYVARESAVLPAEAISSLVPRWIEAACAQGTRGVGFDSWPALREDVALLGAITSSFQRVRSPDFASLWGVPPIATMAVLLSPLAEGLSLSQQFSDGTASMPRGLYGFGQGLVSGEPATLVNALRWGTAFGSVDYLSPDDLETSLDVYNTILAPQLLSCPLETAISLGNYVFRGGVLVSDLGLGALQNGGQANAIPARMSQLFGVPGSYDLRPLVFNLRGVSSTPLLPSWSRLVEMRRNVSLTMGSAQGNAAFGGPTGFSPLTPTADVVALGPDMPLKLGEVTQIYRAPLTVNRVGAGFAIFAPFRLWEFWRPGHAGWNEFHGDLWGRGAALALPVSALVPLPVGANEGQTLFPEVVNRSQSLTLLNHDAPGNPAKLTTVQTSSIANWLWSGGITLFSDPKSNFVGERPPPISSDSPFQTNPRAVTLFARVPVGEAKTLQMVPVAAQNMVGGPLCTRVTRWEKNGVELLLWPNTDTVLAAQDDWQPAPGLSAPVRVTVHARRDGYNFSPASRHRVTITDFSKPSRRSTFPTTERIVVAGANGELSVEIAGTVMGLRIAPVSK